MKQIKSQIYHGINKYSNKSCIVYHIDTIPNHLKKNISSFLEYLKSKFNYIYKDLQFKKQKIVITTHFPVFWEWANKGLTNLISLYLEKSYSNKKETNFKDEIKKHLKKYVGTASALTILNSAAKLDIPVITFKLGTKRYHKLGYGANSGLTTVTSSSKDSKMSLRIQGKKDRTNYLADKLGLPVPKWKLIETKDELRKVWSEFKHHELVLKPYNLTHGKGVYVGIKDLEDALKKFDLIMDKYEQAGYKSNKRKIIIQKRIYGKDYRLFCLDGEFKIATLRTPAYVMGNSKDTIQDLIKHENKHKRRNKDNIFPTLKPIIIDDIAIETITEQGYKLNSVPKDNKQVFVKKAASVSQGGFTTDVTDKVHKTTIEYCNSIASIMNAFTLGIDIMCTDISQPLIDKNGNSNGGLIEVNTAPEMYLNVFPYKGKNHKRLGEKYIERLMPKGLDRTPVIRIINNNEPKLHNVLDKYTHTYLYTRDTITHYAHGKRLSTISVNKIDELMQHLYLNSVADAIVLSGVDNTKDQNCRYNLHYKTEFIK